MEEYRNFVNETLGFLENNFENVIPAGRVDQGIHLWTKDVFKKAERLQATGKKEELEILVIKETLKLLTEKNIRRIAKEVAKISAEDPYSNKYKSLKKEEDALKKKIKNLISAVEDGIATKFIYEQLSERENELDVLQRRIAEAKLLDTAIAECDVISFLNEFKNGNIENPTINKMMCDLLIHQVLVSDSGDNKKEITIVCNAHNHNLDSVSYSTIFKGSPNLKYGGDEGSRTPVQE